MPTSRAAWSTFEYSTFFLEFLAVNLTVCLKKGIHTGILNSILVTKSNVVASESLLTKASTEGGLQNICSESTFQLDMAVCSYLSELKKKVCWKKVVCSTEDLDQLEKYGLFY